MVTDSLFTLPQPGSPLVNWLSLWTPLTRGFPRGAILLPTKRKLVIWLLILLWTIFCLEDPYPVEVGTTGCPASSHMRLCSTSFLPCSSLGSCMVFSPKSCSILYDSTTQDDDLTSPPLDLSAAVTSVHTLGLVIIPDSSTLKADFLFSDLNLIPSRKHVHQGLPPADTSITSLSQFLRDLSPPHHQMLSLN